MSKKFYVTTPIYYPSGKPHIGSAYTTILADILSRWHRLQGKEVFFLTGTDEHTKKVIKAAEKEGKTPKEYTDYITPIFQEAWEKLNIKYDRFIRTSDKDHKKFVEYVLDKVYKKNEIYKGKYEGLYCYDCEAYYTEQDTPDKLCPVHKKPLEILSEDTYFFKLSKYQKKLLDFYEKNPEFILPKYRRNEIINRVKNGLKDLSISRKNEGWGVQLPFDKTQVAYVWYDALTNYLSGIGILENKKLFNKFWPADVHLVGKDILWFHAVIFPAILFALKIEQPKKIFAHGWWLTKDTKIGKSSGNATDLNYLIDTYGADSLRYFLLREIPLGNDGDFSEGVLIDRHNNELANDLGNLVSRILTLVETNFNSKIKKSKLDKKLTSKLDIKKIQFYMDKYELHNALNEIWKFVKDCNKHINDEKLWGMEKKAMEYHLYTILESMRVISILLSPFIPKTSEEINKQLGVKLSTSIKDCKFGLVKNYEIKKGNILFKKIEAKETKPQTKEETNMVKFEEWEKLDFRVGEIKEAKEHPNADKLVVLKVDIGTKVIQLVAGLKKYYEIKNLVGRKVIVFTNLEPIELRGVKSEGMLLAAVDEKNDKVVFLTPEKDVSKGAKVR